MSYAIQPREGRRDLAFHRIRAGPGRSKDTLLQHRLLAPGILEHQAGREGER
jgi:hypothetical protein